MKISVDARETITDEDGVAYDVKCVEGISITSDKEEYSIKVGSVCLKLDEVQMNELRIAIETIREANEQQSVIECSLGD